MQILRKTIGAGYQDITCKFTEWIEVKKCLKGNPNFICLFITKGMQKIQMKIQIVLVCFNIILHNDKKNNILGGQAETD